MSLFHCCCRSNRSTGIKIDGEVARFSFGESLKAKSVVNLEVEFTGTHNDKMSGFYRSQYKDAQDQLKYMVVTQFEATGRHFLILL